MSASDGVPKVASGELDLPHEKEKAPVGEHKTVIEIRQLHRKLTGRTLGKGKNYLRSLYRRDINAGWLVLRINNEVLSWDVDSDFVAYIITQFLLFKLHKSPNQLAPVFSPKP